jgi:hypothetical protein
MASGQSHQRSPAHPPNPQPSEQDSFASPWLAWVASFLVARKEPLADLRLAQGAAVCWLTSPQAEAVHEEESRGTPSSRAPSRFLTILARANIPPFCFSPKPAYLLFPDQQHDAPQLEAFWQRPLRSSGSLLGTDLTRRTTCKSYGR